MTMFCISLCVAMVSSNAAANFTTKGELEQYIVKQILDDKYDWRIRPRGTHPNATINENDESPVVITVNLYLRTISKVDDVNMEYSAHFTFRENWVDKRLDFANLVNSTQIKFVNLPTTDDTVKIWMPDTFFQNEKEGRIHDIDKPNILLRIYTSGQILYSVRMTLMLSCPMNLKNYPLDTQRCFIDLASYAYTADDIKYEWKSHNPIQIKQGLEASLPSFKLSNVQTGSCTSQTNTGTYSCLRTILTLKREFSYYLLQLYIPSFMLVAVSWVSFWLDKDSVPARVTLGVTTLLTMTTQASGINAKLPPVSYTKAIDVWIGVCLAFIFGALLEFALVNYYARKDMLDEIKARHGSSIKTLDTTTEQMEPFIQSNEMPVGFKNAHFNSSPPRIEMMNNYVNGSKPIIAKPVRYRSMRLSAPKRQNFNFTWMSRIFCLSRFAKKYPQRSKRIDVIARVIFPVAFVVFNVMYWIRYLLPYMNEQSSDN